MILALILAGLTAAALAFIVLPLFLQRVAPARRAEYDIAVYKDQLREVERDVARGALDGAAAQSARLEIERRLLAADSDARNADGMAGGGLARGSAWRWTAALALILAPAAVLIYLDHGTPGMPQISFADRAADREADADRAAQVAGLIGQVEARLAANPDDLRGWLLLARAYVRMGRIEDALKAQATAGDLFDQEPDLAEDAAESMAAFGELLMQAAQGAITPEARAAFGKAIGYDARNPRARYFLAFAKMQDGDPRAALVDWKTLIADTEMAGGDMPPWLASLKQRIAEIEASRQP